MGQMIISHIPTKLTVQFMFDKYIQTIPVLNDDLLSAVHAYIKTKDAWQQSTIFDSSGKLVESTTRTCDQFWFNNDFDRFGEVVAALNKGAEQYAQNVIANIPAEYSRIPLPCAPDSQSRLEPINLLRYTEGREYQWHCDATPSEMEHSKRCVSVVLYLNDDFEGGGTEFIDKARKAKPGEALYFPSNWTFLHRAQPVTKGIKYAMVSWYYVYLT